MQMVSVKLPVDRKITFIFPWLCKLSVIHLIVLRGKPQPSASWGLYHTLKSIWIFDLGLTLSGVNPLKAITRVWLFTVWNISIFIIAMYVEDHGCCLQMNFLLWVVYRQTDGQTEPVEFCGTNIHFLSPLPVCQERNKKELFRFSPFIFLGMTTVSLLSVKIKL